MTASDASTGSLQNPAQAARKVVGEAFTARMVRILSARTCAIFTG